MTKKLAFILLLLSGCFSQVFADASNGTIDPGSNGNKNSLVCHDTACTPSLAGKINWKPTLTGTGLSHITIDSSGAVSGYAWGNELGWINMNVTGSEGVKFDENTGVASGMAWSSVGGWINFGITTTTGVSRVTIDSNGNWNGYAWAGGQGGGWIKFECPGADTCVNTDWRISSLRPTPGSGGGGGGIVQDIGLLNNLNNTQQNTILDTQYNSQTGPQDQRSDYSNSYRSDIDDKGVVDVFDFNLLMVNWNKNQAVNKTLAKPDRCKVANIADVNCDGVVGILDFNLVMVNWGLKLQTK